MTITEQAQTPDLRICASNRKSAILTLIGANLVKVAAGIASVWGSSGMYFISYLHEQDSRIDELTNAIIMIVTVIPLSILVLFATKLSDKYGFSNTIRACSIVFFLSQFGVYWKFNIVTLTIFLMIIPISAVTVSLIPTLSCLWTHFTEQKNLYTAISIVFLGIGGVLWNLLFLTLVNPLNLPAQVNPPHAYFPPKVTKNVLHTTKIVFMLCSFIYLIGAFMISKNEDYGQSPSKLKNKQLQQIKYQQNEQKMQNNYENQQNNDIGRVQKVEIVKTDRALNSSQIMQSQKLNDQDLDLNSISLCVALRDPRCLLIFSLLILSDIYPIYLVNNFKMIYMPYYNDDHLLGCCLVLNTITTISGTFLWGYLGDRIGTSKTMLILLIISFLAALMGIGTNGGVSMMIAFMAFVGLADRGMETIAGPALVEIFNLRIATELLPYKALSLILGFLIGPILQLATSNHFTPFSYLQFLIVTCGISLILGVYYYWKYGRFQQREVKMEEMMAKEELKNEENIVKQVIVDDEQGESKESDEMGKKEKADHL